MKNFLRDFKSHVGHCRMLEVARSKANKIVLRQTKLEIWGLLMIRLGIQRLLQSNKISVTRIIMEKFI